MLEILIKGLIIGVAIAAPVGPMALLCMKRTISDGVPAGLLSGMGIALADATYGVMVAAGLTAVGVLTLYAVPMKIAGGLLIAFLGFLAIKKYWMDEHSEDEAAKISTGKGYLSAFMTSYLLTIANPMTIIAFVGMIAGLGALSMDEALAPYILVLGVFLGSAFWWLFLISITAMARQKITPKMAKLLDLVSGSILLLWGLYIAISALL